MNPPFSQHLTPETTFSPGDPAHHSAYGSSYGEYQGTASSQPVQYRSGGASYPPQPVQPSGYSSRPFVEVEGLHPPQHQPPVERPYPPHPPVVERPYPPNQPVERPYPPHPPLGQPYPPLPQQPIYPSQTSRQPSHPPYQPQYHESVHYQPQLHSHGAAPREHSYPKATPSFMDGNVQRSYGGVYENTYNGATTSAHPGVSSSRGYNNEVPLSGLASHSAPLAARTYAGGTTIPSSFMPLMARNNYPHRPQLSEPFYANPQPGPLNVPVRAIPRRRPTIPQPQQDVYEGVGLAPGQSFCDPNAPQTPRGATVPPPQERAYDTGTSPLYHASGTSIPQPLPDASGGTFTTEAPPRTSGSTNPQPSPNAASNTAGATIGRADTSTTPVPTSTTHNDASEPQKRSVPPTEPPAVSTPPNFVPPLDLGPDATYEDAVALWRELSQDDHLLMAKLYVERERRLAESRRLFTIGSAGPQSSAVGTKKRKPRQAARTRPTTQRQGHDHPKPADPASQPPSSNHTSMNTNTSSSPAPASHNEPPATEVPPAGATKQPPPGPSKTFKTVRVEDYHSDSDSEGESDEDTVRIPSDAKGKGRAVDPSPGSTSPKIPTLNPRPNVAPPVQNCGSPFSAVLDAFYKMNERMGQLEISVTQGLKQMDAKLSDFSTEPPVVQPPHVPTGRMTKTQATVTRILTGGESGKTSRRPATGVRVPTRFGYATLPKHTAQPPSTENPPFTNAWAGVPAQPQAASDGVTFTAQQTSQPTMVSNRVPPAAGGDANGQQNARMSTVPPMAPAFNGRFAGRGGFHVPPLNQAPPVRLQSGPTSTPAMAMTEEELSENMKLYRKYVRSHLWEQLLGIKGVEQLHERCSRIPDDEYERFLHTKGRVINATNFRIDFTRGWERCKFNVEARNFFAHHFVASVRGGMYQNPPLPSDWITVDMAAEVLDAVIVHIFRMYRERSKPPTVHNQAQAEMNKERKRANTRRDTLLKWRIETLDKLNLQRHLVLFANITPAHLSGDEAAVGTDLKHSHYRLFYIIEVAWQSRSFKNFVRDLDKWYIYFSRPKIGATQRGGNRPRIREELPKGKARVVDSIAPRGLWRNCYDEDWLNTLKVCEREELGIIDEDYNFSLPIPPPLPAELQPASAATGNNNSSHHFTFGSSGSGLPNGPGSSVHAAPTAPAASSSTIPEGRPNSDHATSPATAPSTT